MCSRKGLNAMALSIGFEVKISPRRRVSADTDDVQVLTLAPFSAVPKIIFKSVVVGQEATKRVVLKNPENVSLEVQVIKYPPPEFGLRLSFLKCTLLPGEESSLSISWQPKEEGKWVHSIQMKTSSGRCNKLTVVCSSAPKKVLKKRENRSALPKLNSKKTMSGINNSKLAGISGNRKLPSSSAYTAGTISSPATTRKVPRIQINKPLLEKDRNLGRNVIKISSTHTPPHKARQFAACSLERARIFQQAGALPKEHPVELLNLPNKTEPEADLNNISSETYPVLSPRSPSSLPESACIDPDSIPERLRTNQKKERDFDDILESIAFSPVSCLRQRKEGFTPLPRSETIEDYSVERNKYISTSVSRTTSTSLSGILPQRIANEEQFYDVSMSPLAHNYPYQPKPPHPRDTYVLPREMSFLSKLDEMTFFNSVEKASRRTVHERPVIDTTYGRGGISPPCKRKLEPERGGEFPVFCRTMSDGQEESGICQRRKRFDEDVLKFDTMTFSPLKENRFNTLDRTDTSIVCSTSYYVHSQRKTKTIHTDLFTPEAHISSKTTESVFCEEEKSRRRLEFQNLKFEVSTPVCEDSKPQSENNVMGPSDISDLFSITMNSEKLSSKTYTVHAQRDAFSFSPHGERFEESKKNPDCLSQKSNQRSSSQKLPAKTFEFSREGEIMPFSPPHHRSGEAAKENNDFFVQKPTELSKICTERETMTFSPPHHGSGEDASENRDFFVQKPTKPSKIYGEREIMTFSPHLGIGKGMKEADDFFVQKPTKPSKICREKEVMNFSPPHRRDGEDNKENSGLSAQKSIKKHCDDKYTPLKSGGKAVQRGLYSKSVKKSSSRLPIAKLLLASKKRAGQKPRILLNPDEVLRMYSNPAFCISATTSNPFVNSAVYYDQGWFDAREKEYVQWLNVLLTPPEQLNSSDEIPKVDVASLWERSCHSAVAPAPSRELVSCRYHINHRLDSLRRAARALFQSTEIAEVLSKVVVQVDKGILSIRKDQNLIRDIGLKYSMIELLLCYNPLWLRIGLETVFGRTISLESNSDRIGLTGFIAHNFLSDAHLSQQYAVSGVSNMFRPGYDETLMKFILKKFLMLVYFLDYAKGKKLIGHNPCLFCRNAQHKESRDMLIAFARDFLSGIGDITKHLKKLGYVVTHKQTYLDEFNYAVMHLGSDLRDGIRLTRVVEIILDRYNLSCQLRTPAVSKLQKIHNVKVALEALRNAGHTLEGNIEAKDIAEGHREKTMSLLWQIIHKFQFPRYNSAAQKIQKWYRSLNVFISRRIWLRKSAEKRRILEEQACLVIQKQWRGYAARKHLKKCEISATKIQRWFRTTRLMKKERVIFLQKRTAAIKIQNYVRNKLYGEKLQILEERKLAASKKICEWLYSIHLMKEDRCRFLTLKHAAIKIQHYWRANLLMKKQRHEFLGRKRAATLMQQRFRALRAGRRERFLYLQKKIAVVRIQSWFRATILMRRQKSIYETQRAAAIFIQEKFRAVKLGREERLFYQQIKAAVVKIQRWFRAIALMREQRCSYRIQRAAAVFIQKKFRAVKSGREERFLYLQKKNAVMKIQRWFRATILMRRQKSIYETQRAAAIFIQEKFRAVKLGREERLFYQQIKTAVVKIQRWFRATALMREQRCSYRIQRAAAVFIQKKFRAVKSGREERFLYLQKKNAVMKIQRWFRATVLMRDQRFTYQSQRAAVVFIQEKFRAWKFGQKERSLYLQKRTAAVKIQRWFRATILMREERNVFFKQKSAAVFIQHWYRSVLFGRKQRVGFCAQREAVIKIQRWYRATALMRKERTTFVEQKLATVRIQRWFRAMKRGSVQHSEYSKQREAVSKIQRWFRNTVLMKQERKAFLKKKQAVLCIQQWYKSVLQSREQRSLYLKERHSAIKIQRWFRATAMMQLERERFSEIKRAAVVIQMWFRDTLLSRQQRTLYLKKRIAAITIQRRFRAITMMKREQNSFLKQKRAVVIIQRWYRAMKLSQQQRVVYMKETNAALKIQRWFRAKLSHMAEEEDEATRLAKQELAFRNNCAAKIQAFWRGYCVRKEMQVEVRRVTMVLDNRNCLRSMYLEGIACFQKAQYCTLIAGAQLVESGLRLSQILCEDFISSGYVQFVMHQLKTANRSEPAEKLVHHYLKLLILILRHPLGGQCIMQIPNSIDVLLHLSTVWCAQKSSNFCLVCTVWWLLGQDPQTAKTIGAQKIVQEKLLKCYTKQLAMAKVSRQRPMPSLLVLPRKIPGWHSVEKNKPNNFLHSKFAITQVLQTLKIRSKNA